VIELEFGSRYNRSVEHSVPRTVKKLTFAQ